MKVTGQKILGNFKSTIFFMLLFLSAGCFYNVEGTMRSDFVVFTPPKCGTHLLTNILSRMLGESPLITDEFVTLEEVFRLAEKAKENKQYLVSHSFTQKMLCAFIDKGYKVFFIVRDPRDQLISMMYWMQKGYWDMFEVSKIVDKQEQIDELITGKRFGWKCYEGCIGFRLDIIKTLDSESVYQTNFEALVGSKGNGDHDLQINEIINIGNFIDIPVNNKLAQEIARECFGGTWSFREGKIGSWKTHFLPYQKSYYKASYSNLLIKLGYESETGW